MAFATRLQPSAIDAEVGMSNQAGLAKETSVGMNDLDHVGIVTTKTKQPRPVRRYKWTSWI